MKKLLNIIPKLLEEKDSYLTQIGALKAYVVIFKGKLSYKLLAGERLERILKIVPFLDLTPIEDNWPKKGSFYITEKPEKLIELLDFILKVTTTKEKNKELGFISLFTDGKGTYWFKVCKNFSTALNESLSSLESLIDDSAENISHEQKSKINYVYRKLHTLYE